MELNLGKLNKKQKQAVCFCKGPLLIVAGAGTGKTTVLTHRLAYLIKQGKAKPEQILAVTFTEKAAQEMEERIDKLLPFGYVDLWVSTFHSFAKRVLEEHGLDIGLPTDFKLLDETASWLLIKQNLYKLKLDYYKPLGNPNKFIHSLISHFSRCKDQGIYPEDYLKYSKKANKEEKKRVKEIAEAYQKYQDLLLQNNLLDFGDLINYCLKLFQKRPIILKEYRKKFKYILVDEFQDTNWAQYKLVKLLAAPKNNLTVSSDDDQAIYRFRGASFSNIILFRKDFPQAKQIVLTRNYRSPQNVLDLAHKFIQLNNPNRLECLSKISKHLLSEKKDKALIEHLHFETLDQEVRGVINKIVALLNKDKKASFNDFAILVRANQAANIFSRALEQAKLPYQFMALRGLYSKPVILDIISYFKLLDNYHENSAVYRVLNLPFLGISSEEIAKITQYSAKKSISIYQSLQEFSADSKLKFILDTVQKHFLLARAKNVSEILLAFLRDSGYLEYLTKKEDRQALSYISQFFNKIKAFEETNIDPCLRNFMDVLNMEMESGEQGKLNFDIEQGPDMLRVMTVHAAKGLEFKYVFLVNLVDKKFPVIERKEPIEIPQALVKDIIPQGDVHLEEERRLFYVGITRAKKGLFFTSAENYGGEKKKKLSRFLTELGYSQKEKNRVDEIKPIKKIRGEKVSSKTLSLPPFFSFTQLRAFENCPLQYKFAHLLRIPIRGRATFSYGKTIHNTLFEFVKKARPSFASQNLGGQAENKKPIGFKELLRIYKQQWIDDWYDNQKQKQEYFENGKNALKMFYRDFMKTKPLILFIEGKPALEQNFNLKINHISFKGKIDRIDKIGDKVEIIDYKTGRMSEKLKPADKEQLLIYQIAIQEVFGLKPKKLTYYYLDGGKKLSFLGSEKDRVKIKEKIISQIKQIQSSDFAPTPGWQCKTCDFKNICEHAQ
ncbi:UvrD-helicase domain-containing protein [Candidatus Parcubacteria bacterium]|nr:UvrD-helicase domain-containing protein [Candidatus Parcubacteria bacterium]